MKDFDLAVSGSYDIRFLDRYGYVTPQPVDEEKKPADNAVMFTIIANLLGLETKRPINEMIRDCYLEKGLITRWPWNYADQVAWDDYLAVAAWAIKRKEKTIPREILGYGFRNFFIFNTDGKLESKDWLGRHIQVWPLMFCAAFPSMKYLMLPIIYLTQLFMGKPDLKDTSGIQLQWLFFGACGNLGFRFTKAFRVQAVIKEAFAIYYHKDHPFNLEKVHEG